MRASARAVPASTGACWSRPRWRAPASSPGSTRRDIGHQAAPDRIRLLAGVAGYCWKGKVGDIDENPECIFSNPYLRLLATVHPAGIHAAGRYDFERCGGERTARRVLVQPSAAVFASDLAAAAQSEDSGGLGMSRQVVCRLTRRIFGGVERASTLAATTPLPGPLDEHFKDSQVCSEFPEPALGFLKLVTGDEPPSGSELAECLEQIRSAAAQLEDDPRFQRLCELLRTCGQELE